MKICNKCAIEKEECEFPFKNKASGRRDVACKVCHREYKKAYYYRNKESHIVRNQKSKDKIRDYVREYKSKLGCCKCGENDYVCLDFHHKDRASKEFNISGMFACGSLDKIKVEVNKCVVMCSNCHRKEHKHELGLS